MLYEGIFLTFRRLNINNLREYFLISIMLFILLISGLDLFSDLKHGVSGSHLIQEAMLFAFATIALVWLINDYLNKVGDLADLKKELAEAQAFSKAESAEVAAAKQTLSYAINEQFEKWQLTDSEKEIGQFLLKGFSLKEVSAIRGTSERTIRQQASSIYKKSGVSGRHAFSAWFLEDLL